MTKRKRTKNDLQIITHKTKDRVTRTPLKIEDERECPGRVGSSYSTSVTGCVNLVTHPVLSREWGKNREFIYDRWNIFVVICDTDIP